MMDLTQLLLVLLSSIESQLTLVNPSLYAVSV
jgi:hypothetical protein